jgi:hypothetical protein
MSTELSPVRLFSNTGGLNDNVDPIHIADDEASDLLNVYFHKGSICKRPGSTKKNDNAVTVGSYGWLGLYDFQTQDGVTQKFIGCADDDIYYYKDDTDEWTSIRDTTMTESLYDFTTFVNSAGASIAVITNGNEPVRKWTGAGTTAALGGSPPFTKAKYLAVHNNQLCVANVYEDGIWLPSRIRISDIKNGESWQTNGYIDLASDDDSITGITSFNNMLVAFERKHIYLCDGFYPTNWSNSLAVNGTGCIAFRSIQTIESPIYGTCLIFLAEDGLHYYQGGKFAPKISLKNYDGKIIDRIHNTINGLSRAYMPYACSVNYKKRGLYILFATSSGGTTNDTAIVYDYINDAFSIWDVPASSACIYEQSGLPLLFTGDYSGFVLQQDSGNADGCAGDHGTATAGGNTTLTDSTKSWTVNAYQGCRVRIMGGTGMGQERTISSNTDTILTVSSAWDTNPDTSSEYSIGYIKAYYDTKWFHYGAPERRKGDRKLELFLASEGDYDLEIFEKKDFQTGEGNKYTVNLSVGASIWGGGDKWGDGTKWGGQSTFSKIVSLGGYGKFIQQRFQNYWENQPFEIHGWINHIKPSRIGD